MHAGALYVLHDAGDENVHSVRDGVHLQLRAHEVLVTEHGVVYGLGEYYVHVALYVVLREGYGHVLAAYDIGRAKQNRVA